MIRRSWIHVQLHRAVTLGFHRAGNLGGAIVIKPVPLPVSGGLKRDEENCDTRGRGVTLVQFESSYHWKSISTETLLG